jgi:hypothetical protein
MEAILSNLSPTETTKVERSMLPLIGFSSVSEVYRGQIGQDLEPCSPMPEATF